MKLREKTLLMIIIPVILIFTSIIGYSLTTMYKKQKNSARALAESVSKEYGTAVQKELEKGLDVSRTTALIVAGLINNDNLISFDQVLKNILLENKDFDSIWVGLEEKSKMILEKIEENTYGICDISGKEIPLPRLDAMPYAITTVEVQDKMEKGLL